MINKITICLIFLITISCHDKKENTNNQLTSKQNIQVDTLSNTAKVNTSSDVNKADTLSSDNDVDNSEIGYTIMENESIGKIKYGLSLPEVIKIYGKPNKETKSIIWGSDGEHHQTVKYLNEGIELDVIGDPGTQKKVNMITITKPSELKTLKNIGIGSDYNDVENAYKDQISTDFSNDTSIVVGSIYGGLIFTLKSNKVESIFMGAAAE